MQFEEGREGDFLIQAGAMDGPGPRGFTAAVVVSKRHVQLDPPGQVWREVWRQEDMALEQQGATAQDALAHAMAQARAWIRSTHLPSPLPSID